MRNWMIALVVVAALPLTSCRGDDAPSEANASTAPAASTSSLDETPRTLDELASASTSQPSVAPATSAAATGSPTPENENKDPAMNETPKPSRELATLGAGCFWCVEAVYLQIDGVISAKSGYMGGHVDNPTYEEVCGKKTGHAEIVQVEFDPAKVTYEQILDWFWRLHDPTTLNRQGNDEGPQYRSAIFYHSDEQREIAERSKKAVAPTFDNPIVTEITAAATFWPAEGVHDNYYFLNKNQGYCQYVIRPKLKKLKLDH